MTRIITRSSPIKSTYKDNHIVRRRAVYTALAPLMEEEPLFRAMWLWERQYANEHSMRLRNFISEIVESGIYQGNAHTAYKNLVQSFMQDPNELVADPYPEMIKHQVHAQRVTNNIKFGAGPPAHRPKETIVFEVVMKDFITSLEKQDTYSIDAIAQNVRDNSQVMDLTMHQKQELLSWIIAKGNKPLSLAFSQSQMSTIINCTYIIACDLIGPVKSDHYLAKAISNAEKIPEASDFSPQHLL